VEQKAHLFTCVTFSLQILQQILGMLEYAALAFGAEEVPGIRFIIERHNPGMPHVDWQQVTRPHNVSSFP
jgi:hypothetical protein